MVLLLLHHPHFFFTAFHDFQGPIYEQYLFCAGTRVLDARETKEKKRQDMVPTPQSAQL